MLKTEQAQTTAFPSRLDKPFDQMAIVHNQRKPQYLDVALAGGSYDLKTEQERSGNESKGKNGIKSVLNSNNGLKSNKVNVFSGNQYNASKNIVQQNKESRSVIKGGKAEQDKKVDHTGQTFQERLKNQGIKNQKLYQELDQMLSGKNDLVNSNQSRQPVPGLSQPKQGNQTTEPQTATNIYKRDNIKLVTKRTLYPSITKETKSKFSAEDLKKIDSVQPSKILGSEHETLHSRELKAKERLANLDTINDFPRKKFADKKKLKFRSSLNPSAPLRQDLNVEQAVSSTQTVSVGIPVRVENTSTRRHIVADIPVYLPSFAGGNQPFQPVVKDLKAVPSETVPNINKSTALPQAKPLEEKPSYSPAPYRSDNPISERLLKEQAEKDKALHEQESYKYFGSDPSKSDVSGKKSVTGTLASDPGPKAYKPGEKTLSERTNPDVYASLRFQRGRLEKETLELKKLDAKQAFIDRQKEDDLKLDFYAQKNRSEERNSKVMEREDSWIKSQLQNTSRSSVGMTTYRNQGRGDETSRGAETYRSEYYGNDRDRNQAYRPSDKFRDRETFNNRDRYLQNDDRRQYDGRERYGRDLPPVDRRYERDTRQDRREKGHEDRDDRYSRETDRSYHGDSRGGRREFRDRDGKNDYRDMRYDPRRDPRDSERGYKEKREYERDFRRDDHLNDRDRYRDPRREGFQDDRNRRGDFHDDRTEKYDQGVERGTRYDRDDRGERDRTRDRNEVQERPTMPKTENSDSKVQYVLRNKSSNSKAEMRKSQSSLKSDSLVDRVPPTATEYSREKSIKSSWHEKSLAESERSNNRDVVRETDQTKTSGGESGRHFDGTENPRYPRRNDFRNGEVMTPVQEMSAKSTVGNRSVEENKNVSESIERSSRVKFLSSNENKHQIEEERRSPWRREDDTPDRKKSPSLIDEAPKHLTDKKSDSDLSRTEAKGIKRSSNENLANKNNEMKDKTVQREKSMDSQGPTDNSEKVENLDENVNFDDINFDDIETEMDEKEIYVCYLLTDDGEKIGPLKLDIDDVGIGLPNPDKLKDITVPAEGESEEGNDHYFVLIMNIKLILKVKQTTTIPSESSIS